MTTPHRHLLQLFLLLTACTPHALAYTSLGNEEVPNEFIPETMANGKKTMTPIGDSSSQGSCCAEPAVFPILPSHRAPKEDPLTDTILDAIDDGDPAKLKEALADLNNAPESVKESVQKSMAAAKEVIQAEPAAPEEAPPSTSPSPSPAHSSSPSPSSSAPPADIGDDRVGATVGDASPAPAPAAEEDDATEDTVDEPTLLIPGHPNVDPLPSYLVHKLTYGDTREVMLSPSHRVVFYILQPGNSERAPSNMHFVATFREPNAAGCQGLTMRLRKHCVSDGSTSVACTQPLQRYAHADGVPASVVREKKVRGDRPGTTTTTTSLRTDVLIGGTKTLEWFEENEYTRRNTFPGWECGCTQGETKWDRVDEYGATWWVEFTNDAETEEARKKKNGAALSCQFQFRVHAVDICSGHGDWTTGGRDRVRLFLLLSSMVAGVVDVLFFF